MSQGAEGSQALGVAGGSQAELVGDLGHLLGDGLLLARHKEPAVVGVGEGMVGAGTSGARLLGAVGAAK